MFVCRKKWTCKRKQRMNNQVDEGENGVDQEKGVSSVLFVNFYI